MHDNHLWMTSLLRETFLRDAYRHPRTAISLARSSRALHMYCLSACPMPTTEQTPTTCGWREGRSPPLRDRGDRVEREAARDNGAAPLLLAPLVPFSKRWRPRAGRGLPSAAGASGSRQGVRQAVPLLSKRAIYLTQLSTTIWAIRASA